MLLPMLALGCVGAHDGTYLLTLTLRESTEESEQDNYGDTVNFTSNLYTTSAGNTFMPITEFALMGTIAGSAMQLEWRSGSSRDVGSCNYAQETTAQLDVEFNSDHGFEGDFDYEQLSGTTNCDDEDDEETDRYAANYDVEAIWLDAAHDAHAIEGPNWGYIGGGGYY